MPHRTNIEWCDFASNPLRAEFGGVRGWSCAKVSPGCKACYAEAINNRFGTKQDYTAANARAATHFIDEKELRHILTFRPRGPFKSDRDRPAVFPCDMTDMFGEWVPDEHLDRIFAAFALRPDVDFLCLTKRAERMHAYCADDPIRRGWLIGKAADSFPGGLPTSNGYFGPTAEWVWPLSNVWLGVSAEDQQRADERIPWLLKTPAAVRFISAEPLLGPIDFSSARQWIGYSGEVSPSLDWVIVGCESGHGRRPMQTEWAANIAEDCKAAGVAMFMKQMVVNGKVSGELGEFPEYLMVREFPSCNERV